MNSNTNLKFKNCAAENTEVIVSSYKLTTENDHPLSVLNIIIVSLPLVLKMNDLGMLMR